MTKVATDMTAATMKRQILELARAGDCGAIIRLIEGWKDAPRTPAPPAPKAMTVQDAASALGISVRGVWRQVGLNNLATIKIGRCTRITTASVDRMLRSGVTA